MKKRKTKRNKIMLMVSFGVVLLMLLSSLPVYAEDPPHGTSEAGIVPELADGNPLTGSGSDPHKVESVDEGDGEDKTLIGYVDPVDPNDPPLVPDFEGTKVNIPTGNPGEDGYGDDTFEVDWEVYRDDDEDDYYYLYWQSTAQVSSVVVKGATGSYIYNYLYGEGNEDFSPFKFYDGLVFLYYYDSGLMAPKNPGGQNSTISHFGFFGTNGTTDPGGDNGDDDNGDDDNGDDDDDTGFEGDPGNGIVLSTGTPQVQSLTVAPERPLTALPATGGSILPMLALSLLLVGSGAVAIRKFKER